MAFLYDQFLSKLIIKDLNFIEAMLRLVESLFNKFSLLSIVR